MLLRHQASAPHQHPRFTQLIKRTSSERHFKFTSSSSHSAFLVPLGPVHTSTAAGPLPDESAVTKHHIRLPPEFEQPAPEPEPGAASHESTPLFVVTGCVKTAHWALGLVEGAGEFTLSVRAFTNTSERQDFDVVVGEEGERGPVVELVSGPNVDHDWPLGVEQFLFLRGVFVPPSLSLSA